MRVAKLAVALTLIGMVWMLVLPRLASKPGMVDYINRLETQRVDPSAMYYTELEMMKPIFERMALARRQR